jgi:hypothetical protein
MHEANRLILVSNPTIRQYLLLLLSIDESCVTFDLSVDPLLLTISSVTSEILISLGFATTEVQQLSM